MASSLSSSAPIPTRGASPVGQVYMAVPPPSSRLSVGYGTAGSAVAPGAQPRSWGGIAGTRTAVATPSSPSSDGAQSTPNPQQNSFATRTNGQRYPPGKSPSPSPSVSSARSQRGTASADVLAQKIETLKNAMQTFSDNVDQTISVWSKDVPSLPTSRTQSAVVPSTVSSMYAMSRQSSHAKSTASTVSALNATSISMQNGFATSRGSSARLAMARQDSAVMSPVPVSRLIPAVELTKDAIDKAISERVSAAEARTAARRGEHSIANAAWEAAEKDAAMRVNAAKTAADKVLADRLNSLPRAASVSTSARVSAGRKLPTDAYALQDQPSTAFKAYSRLVGQHSTVGNSVVRQTSGAGVVRQFSNSSGYSSVIRQTSSEPPRSVSVSSFPDIAKKAVNERMEKITAARWVAEKTRLEAESAASRIATEKFTIVKTAANERAASPSVTVEDMPRVKAETVRLGESASAKMLADVAKPTKPASVRQTIDTADRLTPRLAKIAAEQAAAEKATAEAVAAQRAAAEREAAAAAAERAAAEKIAQQKAAIPPDGALLAQAAAAAKAAEEREAAIVAAERAANERIAREREKIAAEQAAASKAVKEATAAQKAAAEREAAAVAAERAAAERFAREKAEAEKAIADAEASQRLSRIRADEAFAAEAAAKAARAGTREVDVFAVTMYNGAAARQRAADILEQSRSALEEAGKSGHVDDTLLHTRFAAAAMDISIADHWIACAEEHWTAENPDDPMPKKAKIKKKKTRYQKLHQPYPRFHRCLDGIYSLIAEEDPDEEENLGRCKHEMGAVIHPHENNLIRYVFWNLYHLFMAGTKPTKSKEHQVHFAIVRCQQVAWASSRKASKLAAQAVAKLEDGAADDAQKYQEYAHVHLDAAVAAAQAHEEAHAIWEEHMPMADCANEALSMHAEDDALLGADAAARNQTAGVRRISNFSRADVDAHAANVMTILHPSAEDAACERFPPGAGLPVADGDSTPARVMAILESTAGGRLRED